MRYSNNFSSISRNYSATRDNGKVKELMIINATNTNFAISSWENARIISCKTSIGSTVY